jgi:WD40 repeat protein
LKAQQGYLRNMLVDPSGKLLVLQTEKRILAPGTLRLFALPSGKLLGELTEKQAPVCLAISRDGRLLAGGLRDGTIVLWRIAPKR